MAAKIDLTKYPPSSADLEIKAGLNGLVLMKNRPLRQRFIPNNGKLVVSGQTICARVDEPELYIGDAKKFERVYADNQKQKRDALTRLQKLRHPTKEMKRDALAQIAYLIPFKKIPDLKTVQPGKEKKEPVKQVANTKKIRALITSMAHALEYGHARPWLSFITVTFEPAVSDQMSKQLLNTWITRCKQLKYFQLFLWRMEQQKNGTAHYHIVIVGKVDIVKINRVMMVAICNQVRKKKLNIHISKAKRYNGIDLAKDRKNQNPAKRKNVINFADPKNAGRLSWYLSKYLTKKVEPLEGRQWACSREWSNFFTALSLSRCEARILSRETGAIDLNHRFENDFCKFYRYHNGPPYALTRMLGRVNWAVLQMFFTVEGDRFIKREKNLFSINF